MKIIKNKLKTFKEKIKLYKDFIKNGKIPETNFPFYKELINTNKKIIDLLENDKMTPKKFSKFGDKFKWEISLCMKNVIWCCSNCKLEITDKRPERTFFPGEVHSCSNCDYSLTKRTGGGQNDPFNYIFK